jgi:hypothetical protein
VLTSAMAWGGHPDGATPDVGRFGVLERRLATRDGRLEVVPFAVELWWRRSRVDRYVTAMAASSVGMGLG